MRCSLTASRRRLLCSAALIPTSNTLPDCQEDSLSLHTSYLHPSPRV